MATDILPPIPNERALLIALREAWHAAGGTAAYRKGILVQIEGTNSRRSRKMSVRLSTLIEFNEEPGG